MIHWDINFMEIMGDPPGGKTIRRFCRNKLSLLSINLANTCPPFKYGVMRCLLLELEVIAGGSLSPRSHRQRKPLNLGFHLICSLYRGN